MSVDPLCVLADELGTHSVVMQQLASRPDGRIKDVDLVAALIGAVSIAFFLVCLVLLFLLGRVSEQRRHSIVRAAARLSERMESLLDRTTRVFAYVVVLAVVGLMTLSTLILILRAMGR